MSYTDDVWPSSAKVSLEQEAALRAKNYRVKRPRFTKLDVRHAARSVFPEVVDLSYTEIVSGLEVACVVQGTGLRPAGVVCKLGEENRARTGLIRCLLDGGTRDKMRV